MMGINKGSGDIYNTGTSGGGGGAVESVTGELVDNTDPANPVVNNPEVILQSGQTVYKGSYTVDEVTFYPGDIYLEIPDIDEDDIIEAVIITKELGNDIGFTEYIYDGSTAFVSNVKRDGNFVDEFATFSMNGNTIQLRDYGAKISGLTYTYKVTLTKKSSSSSAAVGISKGVAPYDRAVVEGTTFLNGGIQGVMHLTVKSVLQPTTINRLATYITQGAGNARGKLCIYEKPLGSNTFTKICETSQISFEAAGLVIAGVPEVTLNPLNQYYMGIVALESPQFLTYTGYNLNAPNQISHSYSNVYQQPVSNPWPDLPDNFNAGSSSNLRYCLAGYKEV